MRNVRTVVRYSTQAGHVGARREEFALTREDEPLSLASSLRQTTGKALLKKSLNQSIPFQNRRAHRYQKFIGVGFFAALVLS